LQFICIIALLLFRHVVFIRVIPSVVAMSPIASVMMEGPIQPLKSALAHMPLFSVAQFKE
jgi:hypothetical protein